MLLFFNGLKIEKGVSWHDRKAVNYRRENRILPGFPTHIILASRWVPFAFSSNYKVK